MNHSFLALAAAAALCCSTLPCLADSKGPAAQPAAAAGQKGGAQDGTSAPRDAAAQQSRNASSASAPSSFKAPDVTVKNCSDQAVLDQVLARVKQAEEKSDLSRSDLEAEKSFSEKCQAVLQNR